MHLTTLTAWAIPNDLLLIYLCQRATETWSVPQQNAAFWTLVVWMLMSKCVKLIGHFCRYPTDIVLLPVSVAFGYMHGFIKLYAMLTLHVVS